MTVLASPTASIVSSAIAWIATMLAGSLSYAVALGLTYIVGLPHDDHYHGVIELVSIFGFATIACTLVTVFQATVCIGLTAPVQILALTLVRRNSLVRVFAALCATPLSALATAYLFDYAVPQVRAAIDDSPDWVHGLTIERYANALVLQIAIFVFAWALSSAASRRAKAKRTPGAEPQPH